jgi:hypothetical protein
LGDSNLARPGDILDGDISATAMPTVAARSRLVDDSQVFVTIGMVDVWVVPTGDDRLTDKSLIPT